MIPGFTTLGGRYKTRTCENRLLPIFNFSAACAAQIACGDEVTSSSSLFHKKKKPAIPKNYRFMVDDTRLELVTSRTSSGCATSCANRPALSSKGYSNSFADKCQEVFCCILNFSSCLLFWRERSPLSPIFFFQPLRALPLRRRSFFMSSLSRP